MEGPQNTWRVFMDAWVAQTLLVRRNAWTRHELAAWKDLRTPGVYSGMLGWQDSCPDRIPGRELHSIWGVLMALASPEAPLLQT
eukprot:1159909-Pelagomonas_calceolata.AAC.3